MNDPTAYLPVLQSGRWFAHLPPEFSQQLLAMAQLRPLQAGEALFLRGDAPCGLYALVRGALSISGIGGRADDARAALLTRLEPPHWFGEISVFDGSARTHDAHAVEASLLLQVPHERLQGWLQAHPEHWRSLALLLPDKLRTAFVAISASRKSSCRRGWPSRARPPTRSSRTCRHATWCGCSAARWKSSIWRRCAPFVTELLLNT